MRLKNTLPTRKILQGVAAFAAFGLLASSAQGQILLPKTTNGDFEGDTPPAVADWDTSAASGGTIETSTTYARTGSNSLLIDSVPVSGSWASPNAKQVFPACAGNEYNFSGYILNAGYDDDANAGTPNVINPNTWGTYKIEFYDENGANLEPESISIGALDGAGQPFVGAVSSPLVGDVFGGGDQTMFTWIFSEVQAVAPFGTVGVRFVVLNVNGSGAQLYYDDIQGYQVVSEMLSNTDFEGDTPPAIADWDITASGGTIESSATYANTGSQSLLIDSSPIVGSWASPNVKQVFPAIPGDEYYFGGYIYNNGWDDDANAGTPNILGTNTWGTYKIEFFDSAGTNLKPAAITPGQLDGDGQPFVGAVSLPLVGDVFGGGDQTLNSWIYSEVGAVAPAGTTGVRFVVLNVNGGAAELFFDDATAYQLCAGTQVKIPITSFSVSGSDLTVAVQSKTTADYEAFAGPDLESFVSTGQTAAGDGAELSFTISGGAPGFARIVETDLPVAAAEVGECIGSDAWQAYHVVTNTTGTATDLDAPFSPLSDVPWVDDGFGGSTFGMNDSLIAGNGDYAGADQVFEVYEEYNVAENTIGLRPLTDLSGKQLKISGTALVSEAYAGGNAGEIFVRTLDNSGAIVEEATVDVSVDDSNPIDLVGSGVIDTGTGAFTVGLNIPDNGIARVQAGFRNSGVLGTAGEVSLTGVTICVDNNIAPPYTGEVLLNPDFTDSGNGSGEFWETGIDVNLLVTASGSFGTFTAAPEVQVLTTYADGVSATMKNDGTPDSVPNLITDQNWQGIFFNALKLQQVIGSPGTGNGAQELNLYEQVLTVSGNVTVNDYGAAADSQIKRITVSGAGNGDSTGGTIGEYFATANGSISGNPATFRVSRTLAGGEAFADGDVAWVNVTDGGNGSVVGDTYTLLSADTGLGGEIIVEVNELTGTTFRIGFESGLGGGLVHNPSAGVGSEYFDVTPGVAPEGVSTPFNFVVTIDSLANQEVPFFQFVIQTFGVEATGGSITVDSLSIIAADP